MRQSLEAKTISLYCENGQHDWTRTLKRVRANQPSSCPDHPEPVIGMVFRSEPRDIPSSLDRLHLNESTKSVIPADEIAADLGTRVAGNNKGKESLLIVRMTAQERQNVVDLLLEQPQAWAKKLAERI